MMQYSIPPLLHSYAELQARCPDSYEMKMGCGQQQQQQQIGEGELPLIDLGGLTSEEEEMRIGCASAICRASSEWGFFQVVNHGISLEVLRRMRREQMRLFEAPFEKKATCGLLNNSYRWGSPNATSPIHFSWSEAFHIPLTNISDHPSYGDFTHLREVLGEYAAAMQRVAKLIFGVLVSNLGEQHSSVYEEYCNESTCFLRLNRYPRCPISSEVFGLVPHTDSDFLTILHQDDQVGGLQLMKDSEWVAVKPNQQALIVNIGDLFQAWSNDAYKSVKHKVMANGEAERYSIAYFLCPSCESLIGSCSEPSTYRRFTFGEYRKQIQEDVKTTGHKVGLSRFLL